MKVNNKKKNRRTQIHIYMKFSPKQICDTFTSECLYNSQSKSDVSRPFPSSRHTELYRVYIERNDRNILNDIANGKSALGNKNHARFCRHWFAVAESFADCQKTSLEFEWPFYGVFSCCCYSCFFCLLNTKTTHDIIHTYSYFSFALCDTGCHRCSLFIMSNKFLHFKWYFSVDVPVPYQNDISIPL